MKEILHEGAQLIHIGPATQLSQTSISYALQRASASRMYAKFYTSKYYIQVNFMKDGTVSVSSNIRNPQFLNSLRINERSGWTLGRLRSFVHQWMQLSRRTLY